MANFTARHLCTLFLCFCFCFCFSCSSLIAIASAQGFVAQITSSVSAGSLLYFASNFTIGTPGQFQQLLISTDAASHSWVFCGPAAPFNPAKSSSFHYTTCGTKPCYEHLQPYNLQGRLAEDTFSLHTSNGSSQGALQSIPGVNFACADVKSRAMAGIKGVATFTGAKSGLPAQLRVTKFAYCLPFSPSDGPTPLFLGDGISYLFGSSPVLMNISAFLGDQAKLKVNSNTGFFSITLKNVVVDLVSLNLSSPLNLQISSVQRYSKLSRHVYLGIRTLFRQKAAERGIQRVEAQSPFDTCFNASTVGFSRVGPAVPVIELHLVGVNGGESGWSVFGFNSIVSVSDTVSCWAFLDAGVRQPSVLGSFQQQGGIFEFDLRNKRLGFSGVLDFYRTTCSSFNF